MFVVLCMFLFVFRGGVLCYHFRDGLYIRLPSGGGGLNVGTRHVDLV
jgi:hypothetical protein